MSYIILTFYMKSHIPFSNYLNITSKMLEVVSGDKLQLSTLKTKTGSGWHKMKR